MLYLPFIEASHVMAAAAGAVVGALIAKNTTTKQGVASAIIGFAGGVYLAPSLSTQFHFPDAIAHAISFCTGIFSPPILISAHQWAQKYNWGKQIEARLPVTEKEKPE